MDSYGYIEVVGLVPAIAAADAALKAANVEVVGRENTGKAMIAVIIKGEIGAVRAAIDAAEAEVERIGKVVSTNVIARPDARDGSALPADDTDYTRKLGRLPKKLKVGFALRLGDHPYAKELTSLGLPKRAMVSGSVGNVEMTFGDARILS